MTLKKIRKAVKDVVKGKSRIIMIFGLEKTAVETLHDTVKELFESIQRKPLFKTEQIGKNRGEDFDRPIEVFLDTGQSNICVRYFEYVEGSQTFSFRPCLLLVFLKPDRTIEQRKNIGS